MPTAIEAPATSAAPVATPAKVELCKQFGLDGNVATFFGTKQNLQKLYAEKKERLIATAAPALAVKDGVINMAEARAQLKANIGILMVALASLTENQDGNLAMGTILQGNTTQDAAGNAKQWNLYIRRVVSTVRAS
jgi:hypothetical protein